MILRSWLLVSMTEQQYHSRILVVRPGALGDSILAFPLLTSIQGLHPHSIVAFLGNRACRDLLPPGIEFHAFDDRNWLWLFSGESSNLHPSGPVFQKAYIILERPQDAIRNLKRAGTESIHHVGSRPPLGTHVVEHLHRGLGLLIASPRPLLTHLAPREKTNLIWIHPGSGGPAKCLPLKSFRLLAQALTRRLGWDLAISSAEEDEFLKELPEWKDLASGPRTRLFENRPLRELCRELGGAKLFIGNDSGIAHLAAGLGIKAAVFYVSTDPAQWGPWAPASQVKVIDIRNQPFSEIDLERDVLAVLEQD
jgi:ADP-heptose:LPS heptosyltransferase